jgi:hypothetical protein
VSRAGGALAVGLSTLWALPAAGSVVFGVLLFLSGRDSDVDTEGFAEFFGGSMAVLGLLVLAGAVGGILLGIRVRRGRDGARVGLGLLFAVFAFVSGMFLVSSFADDSGVDPGGVIGFGLNTLACVAIVLSTVVGTVED